MRAACALLGLAAYLFHMTTGSWDIDRERSHSSHDGHVAAEQASGHHPHEQAADTNLTPVAANAIAVTDLKPGEREICEHHPEGCPKACLCPKIRVQSDGSVAEESPLQARTRGPALTACSEGAQHAPHPPAESGWASAVSPFLESCSSPASPPSPAALLAHPSEPPFKIPIA